MTRILRMYPSLLRVGLASALAYRAELLVWVLTTNLPLINLALWSAVAREAPVGRFGQAEFAAYFLCTLMVRQLTGVWVAWEMTMEIRSGTLALRLLRPIHPVLAYSAENLASLPMRAMVAIPIGLVVAIFVGTDHLSHDPLTWVVVPFAILGAWVLTFLVMAALGCVSFFVDSAFSLFEVWLGLYTVFSGYLVPLELFPQWLQRLAAVLPFRSLLGFPVEAMLGLLTRAQLLEGLAMQAGYIVVFLLLLRVLWNAGMKRFAAFGG